MSDRFGACRIGLGLALLAAGVVGLGPGSAAGSVRIEWSNERFLVSLGDFHQPRPAELGATIKITTVDPGALKRIVADQLARLAFPELDPLELEPTRLPETRAGGNAIFGRSTFSWVDENGNEIAQTVNPPLRNEIPDGYLPPFAPGSFPSGYLGGPSGGEPVPIFGRPSYVWVDADGNPVSPRLGVRAYPFLWTSGYFDPDLVRAGWNALLFLVSNSCVGEDDPACFNPDTPLRADGCSFNAPLLCEGLRGFVAPWLAVPLEVERLRIKARRGSAKLRVSGRVDLSDLALDAGSFSVAIGGMQASIPLEDFQRRGRLRVWRGSGDGLRVVVLRDDGRFRIIARGLDPGLFAGEALPVILQVGGGLAATSVPLR